MPLFPYTCQDCGGENEILIRGKEEPLCPVCESKNLVKGLSLFAMVSSGGAQDPMGCGAPSCCQLSGGDCMN